MVLPGLEFADESVVRQKPPRWAVQPGDVIELPDGRQKFVTDRRGQALLLEDGQWVPLASVRRAWRPEPVENCPACQAWQRTQQQLQDARRAAPPTCSR